jgi:hypothetical protein
VAIRIPIITFKRWTRDSLRLDCKIEDLGTTNPKLTLGLVCRVALESDYNSGRILRRETTVNS